MDKHTEAAITIILTIILTLAIWPFGGLSLGNLLIAFGISGAIVFITKERS